MLVEFLHDIMKQQTSLSVSDVSPISSVKASLDRAPGLSILFLVKISSSTLNALRANQ